MEKQIYDDKKNLTTDFSWLWSKEAGTLVDSPNNYMTEYMGNDSHFYCLEVIVYAALPNDCARAYKGYIDIPYLCDNNIKLNTKGIINMVFEMFKELLSTHDFSSCIINFPSNIGENYGYVPIIHFWKDSENDKLYFRKLILENIPELFPQIKNIFYPAYIETYNLRCIYNSLLYRHFYGEKNEPMQITNLEIKI